MSLDLDFNPSSFATNPLVQAMGNAVGLNFSAAAATPPPPVPPMRAPSKEPVPGSNMNREFRQHAPVARMPRGGAAGSGPGPGMGIPGVMSPEVLMHPEVQKLLNQYGISPEMATQAAQQASPNLFVTNPEAYQKHPVLANLVERGLEGLAFTHGGMTTGESISNVAKGMMDANAARVEKYNNQLMMPMLEAQQVGNLKEMGVRQQFEQAQAARDWALMNHYSRMDDLRGELNDIHRQQMDNTAQNQRLGHEIQLRNNLSKYAFNPEEQSQLENLVAGTKNGLLAEVNPADIQKIINSAAERRFNQTQAGLNTRAGIMAGTRKQLAGTVQKGNQLKAAAEDAQKTLDNFTKELTTNFSATGPDGRFVTAGTPEAQQVVQQLTQQAQAARQAFNDYATELPDIGAMAVPGSGMVPSTPHKPSGNVKHFNPLTGKIE